MENSLKYYLENIYIYILKDPNTDEIRYVGMTREPHARLSSHLRGTKRYPKGPKGKWIQGLMDNQQKPVMEIVEVCNSSNWHGRESYWIAFYKEQGYNLTNGGEKKYNRR